MGKVLDINKDRHFVRFFTEPVDCDWCEAETYGYVYERMQSIVCSKCKEPLLIIEDKPMMIVTFDDGSEMEFDDDS